MSLKELFAEVGCLGSVCAIEVHGTGGFGINADERVVPAFIVKVPLALAVLMAFEDGSLDPTARIRLPTLGRTAGPTGISLWEDDVEASARDLVVASLTVSDNAATDALFDLVGVARVNALTRELGLTDTHIAGTVGETIDQIGQDAGFTNYAGLERFWKDHPDPTEAAAVQERVWASAALDPDRGSCTTAADMARLLTAVWRDEAASPTACSRLRQLLGHQLTRNRIASAFEPDVEVAAKSGGLMGLVRNEIGVVTFRDRRAYSVDVFTRATRPVDGRDVDSAIGRAARLAVGELRDR